MSTPEHILTKIKYLFNLSQSSNENEALAAMTMAEKLVIKYNISDKELKSLEEPKPLYTEDEKLFSTPVIISWKSQLALLLATHFNSFIVQEMTCPSDGSSEYNYFVYGDPEDINSIKFCFVALNKKIENIINIQCFGRGDIFISSFCEGVIQGLKDALPVEGLIAPKSRNTVSKKDALISQQPSTKNALVPNIQVKEKPLNESVNVNSHSLIKDIAAYFKGIAVGSALSLQDIVDNEFNNTIKELE